MGLIVGGALTEVSWRWAFLINVPIGLLMIHLARRTLRETHRERLKLDATGAILATLGCTAAVFAFSMGPEQGWLSTVTIGSGLAAGAFLLAFVYVERTAENPVDAAGLVQGSQPGRHVRRGLPRRRCDVHADRADRPLRPGHHGLQRLACGHRLHPVRDRTRRRAGVVVGAGVAVPAARAGDRRRRAGARAR